MLGKKKIMHLNRKDTDTSFHSAIQIFYEIVEAYKSRSVKVCFVRLREQPFAMFKKSGLLYLVGESHLFIKVSEAIEYVELDISKRATTTPYLQSE
jgi:MFS superfamily sulfate permease-like transporter